MSPPSDEHRSGCLSCGAPLVYSATSEPMRCAGCGQRHDSPVRCEAGHFFCDVCHSGSTVDAIEAASIASDETDPVALARAVMHHPKVKMHGSEHHFLTPAALLTAWCNVRREPEERKRALVAEAKRRGSQVPGGTCGYWGACGAGIGAGIFVSLVTGATPRSKEPWALAQAMTAEVLATYAKVGGPRCCKRNTWLALLTASAFARKHLDTALVARGPRCEFSPMNPDCHRERCPFHPRATPPAVALEAR